MIRLHSGQLIPRDHDNRRRQFAIFPGNRGLEIWLGRVWVSATW